MLLVDPEIIVTSAASVTSPDNNQPVARYKSNMTPNDIALEDAKSVLEFNLVNNVGDAAVDKPHDNMNEANSTVIDLKDAAEIETQNPAVSGQIPRVTTSTEGEFDEHHQQSLRAMALRKEVLDKKHGRPNQPAVTVAGPLQPIKNGLVENKAAIDAVNGSNNLDPISKASASQQEHQSVSTCKKILDLKSTVDKIIETSKASQGANIIAFPELVKPELGTRAAINTAGYPELIETEVGKEVGTAAATNNAGPVGTEVGTAAAMNTTGYTVSRNLFVFVLLFNTPSISLGGIAFFLSCTIHNCCPVGNPHPRHTISQHRHCYRVRGSPFQRNILGG